MGAVDVIPFLPIRGVTMDDCIALARDVGREIAETLGMPVYLYDRAALMPERREPGRRPQGRVRGPRRPTWPRGGGCPTSARTEIGRAGAVAVGARKPLVAFNVYLRRRGQEEAAKAIAKSVREVSGGLKNVRAIGFFVPGARLRHRVDEPRRHRRHAGVPGVRAGQGGGRRGTA